MVPQPPHQADGDPRADLLVVLRRQHLVDGLGLEHPVAVVLAAVHHGREQPDVIGGLRHHAPRGIVAEVQRHARNPRGPHARIPRAHVLPDVRPHVVLVLRGRILRRLHPQRVHDVALHVVRERQPVRIGRPHDQPQRRNAGVGVVELSADLADPERCCASEQRACVAGVACPECIFERHGLVPYPLRAASREPGAMGEQVVDGDVPVTQRVVHLERQMLADRVVQRDHPPVDQVHDRRGRVGLAQRPGVVHGLRRHRLPRRDIGPPEARLPDQFAPVAHGEVEARGPVRAHGVQHVVARGVDEAEFEGAVGVDAFRDRDLGVPGGGLLLRLTSRKDCSQNGDPGDACGEGNTGSDSQIHDRVQE